MVLKILIKYMRKLLLNLMIGCSFASLQSTVHAAPDTLFTIPDTICAGHMFVPEVLVKDGRTYDWRFCTPSLHTTPLGVNLGDTFQIFTPTDLVIDRSHGTYVGFVANSDIGLTRWIFRDGIESVPLAQNLGNLNNTLPVAPNGLEYVYDEGQWYLFVIGGTSTSNTQLVRYTIGDNLNNTTFSDTLSLGNLDGQLSISKRLLIAKDNGQWIGFTFNQGRELIRLNFGSDITSTPTVENLGNLGTLFQRVSSINAIREGDNWIIHVTDMGSNRLVKLLFGTELLNTPFAVDYSTLSGQLNYPTGLAIIPNCREYFGYAINQYGSHTNTLYWDESVGDLPATTNNGNIGMMSGPMALSQVIVEDGKILIFAVNSDSSLTRMYYNDCGSATLNGSSDMVPEPFTYLTPGLYNIFLTIDGGSPNARNYCQYIYVTAPPDVSYSNDTLICVGDTVTIRVQYAEDLPTKWTPNYNIQSTDLKETKVWPEFSTEYINTVSFAPNCVLSHGINVTVSHVYSDAGEDRSISDGSMIYLGGPMTSLGDEFTYRWFPTNFFTGVNNEPFTSARPELSITYYLEVTNTDGCVAIDSMNVEINCDDVNLPNAFVPLGHNVKTATFGLLNQQIVKLNSFKIYDRWGTLVFTTTDVNKRWDGTYNGVPVPKGVYVWEVDGFCISGARLVRSGNVTLIR